MNDKTKGKTRRTAVILFGIAGGMVGLAYASVPLYQLFCQVTGYGGTPRTEAENTTTKDNPHAGKIVTVRFDANTNKGLPWNFQPEVHEMKVPVGETVLAFYKARNLSDRSVMGTATFNVTPFKAASYFAKVDCFCFTEQALNPGQEVRMPVSFYVDPEMFDDKHAKDVNEITLSYTFFRMKQEASEVDTSTGSPKGGAL